MPWKDFEVALEVFLADPDVPVNINRLERTLRAIPMEKNWLFVWCDDLDEGLSP
jgi:hypothetical protein